MPPVTLDAPMAVVLALLGLTVVLFAFDVVRSDVAALSILILLGLADGTPGIGPLLPEGALFSGFGSSAVIAIIAVMIIGAGLDRTGVMQRVAGWILDHGGGSEARVLVLVCAAVALVSFFVQNVAAAALFLPVVGRIGQRAGIPVSRLMMPMGFCAILGGLGTTIGSSSMIVLNDLLGPLAVGLPEGVELEPYGLFSIMPVGLVTTAACIGWFLLLGRLTGSGATLSPPRTGRTDAWIERVYGISGELREARVGRASPLAGRRVRHVEERVEGAPFILALYSGDVVKVPPDPEETLWVGTRLGLLGSPEAIDRFCAGQRLEALGEPERFAGVLDAQQSGIVELVVPPGSEYVGRAIGDIKPRRNLGANILQIARDGQTTLRGFGDIVLQPGDTLLVHARWRDLETIRRTNNDLIVVTDFRYEPDRRELQRLALVIAVGSLVLFGLTGELATSLMAGAAATVLARIVTIDEAYSAVSWSTIFLLAGLYPLGLAVDATGAATWIAQGLLGALGEVPGWIMQTLLAVLATIFSLIVSNVGATLLLVPIAVGIAVTSGADPGLYALTVAVSTSNAFLIPTNQVNALIAGPGGYRVADFMRVGGGMTVLFLVTSLVTLNLVFG